MKPISVFLLLFLLISVSSCDVVVGIFEVGLWTGIILVVVIVLIVLYVINKFRR